jgi:hypothetical protein
MLEVYELKEILKPHKYDLDCFVFLELVLNLPTIVSVTVFEVLFPCRPGDCLSPEPGEDIFRKRI